MGDVRKPIDVLLNEEGKMITRGAEMIKSGETGESCCLNQINTPEISTTFTPRKREFYYVATVNGYDF